MSSTKKIVGQLRQLRELITKSPTKKVTSSKRIISTKTESVHSTSTHQRKKGSEVTSAEIKSRSERTESKTSAKAKGKSGTSKTEKSVTTKVIERKPIKNTRKGEVPPSIRDSKFRLRREAETDKIHYKDTFVDPVPNLKKKKSPPKKAVDDEIHKFSSKLIKRHEDSSESDEFLLKPCKQAIQSRAAIKKRVISSSSDDEVPPRDLATKRHFWDDSSSSDSEFQMRMKRVSALTGAKTLRKSSVPKKRKNSRVSPSSSTSESDVKLPRRKVVDTSSDSSDFKMPVIKGRAKERPNIDKILKDLDLSDYSDEDMKLVTPPKRVKKAKHVSSGSSSESLQEVRGSRTATRRTVLQLSVPISISTRSEFGVNDSNTESGEQKKAVSKAAVVETSEDSGRDVRAELLRKYGVFTSSSDDAPKDRKGEKKKSASPSMTRDEIKSKLAKFRLGSSDSEEYASSDADTISQKLLSKHEYASQLVDMNEEVSPSQKELKAKMQELGVTDSSSSGVQAPAPPAAEEPKKTKRSSGVDKNFLRKYGISDSSTAVEEVIELVNPRELQERKKVTAKATDASVDSSLVRDQKHILAAYGVTESSSDEKEDSSKLLAGSLRERLAKLEMTDEELEDEGHTPAPKKVSYEVSSSSSDTVNRKSLVGESKKMPPVKSEASVSEQSRVSKKATAGIRAEEDITPEEILVSSMSNVRSVIQTAHFSSDDEEELVRPIPAKTTNVAKPATVLDSSTSSVHEQEKTSTTQVSRLLHNSSASSSASIGVAHTKSVVRQGEEKAERKQTASISLSRVKQMLLEEEDELETPASAALSRAKQVLADEEEDELQAPASAALSRAKQVLVDEEEDELQTPASAGLARAKQILIDEEEDELQTPASAGLARAKQLLIEEEEDELDTPVSAVHRKQQSIEEDKHEARTSINAFHTKRIVIEEEEDAHEAIVRNKEKSTKQVLTSDEEENTREPVIMIEKELVQAGPQIRIPTRLPSSGVLNAVANGEISSDDEDLKTVKQPSVSRPIPKPPQKPTAKDELQPLAISSSSDDELKRQFQNVKTALLKAQNGSDSDSETPDVPTRIPLKVSASSDDEQAQQPRTAPEPQDDKKHLSDEDDSDTSLGLTAEAILNKYNISLGDDSGSDEDIDLDDVDRKTQEILARFK